MKPWTSWLAQVGLAGSCLTWVGCGGNNAPEADSDAPPVTSAAPAASTPEDSAAPAEATDSSAETDSLAGRCTGHQPPPPRESRKPPRRPPKRRRPPGPSRPRPPTRCWPSPTERRPRGRVPRPTRWPATLPPAPRMPARPCPRRECPAQVPPRRLVRPCREPLQAPLTLPHPPATWRSPFRPISPPTSTKHPSKALAAARAVRSNPTVFKSPFTAANAFLTALQKKNPDWLAQSTALRASTEASPKYQKVFTAILEQSLAPEDLDELAKKFDGMKIMGNNTPKSTGRYEVIVGKCSREWEFSFTGRSLFARRNSAGKLSTSAVSASSRSRSSCRP